MRRRDVRGVEEWMALDSVQPPHEVALARRERIGVERLGIY